MYHQQRADLLFAESLIALVQELDCSIEAMHSAGMQVPAGLLCEREALYETITRIVSSVPLRPLPAHLYPIPYRVPSA